MLIFIRDILYGGKSIHNFKLKGSNGKNGEKSKTSRKKKKRGNLDKAGQMESIK